jgi:hypothetical protein
MPKRSRVLRASRSMRVTVTTSPGASRLSMRRSSRRSGPRPGHLLQVDVPAAASGGAQLLKLAVKGLPVRADARVADKPFFRMSFGHVLRQS